MPRRCGPGPARPETGFDIHRPAGRPRPSRGRSKKKIRPCAPEPTSSTRSSALVGRTAASLSPTAAEWAAMSAMISDSWPRIRPALAPLVIELPFQRPPRTPLHSCPSIEQTRSRPPDQPILGRRPRLLFLGEHPVDRGAGVDRGRVVDRKHVGADVDRQHQLGAAEDDRLDLLLGELGDQGLELALAVADDAAGGEFLEDDAVDLVASSRRRSARARSRARSSRLADEAARSW